MHGFRYENDHHRANGLRRLNGEYQTTDQTLVSRVSSIRMPQMPFSEGCGLIS